MAARAVDTDEDTKIDTQPRGLRGSAITTLVVARETANPRHNPLKSAGKGLKL